ncbi:MAG: carboxypeptidase regulatory-like domain-containing protein [Dehalococcoidia bacterium]|nr:carboxypeptidase regulatory-like domain-containing protein [Dehalococcoidia bacterium]
MLDYRRLQFLNTIVRIASSIFLGATVLWIVAPLLVMALTEASQPAVTIAGAHFGPGFKPFPARLIEAAGISPQTLAEPAVVGGDDRFGINFVNSVEVDTAIPSSVALRYGQASAAGATWTRWPMYWHDIERYQGVRDYSRQDAVVNLDVANGLQPQIILMFSPSWAATAGDATAPFPRVGERSFKPEITPTGVRLSSVISPPKNLYLAWNDPGNYWGKFVFDTVSRYKDRVKVWEMWNEPDFSIFWSGSVADYYQLLKVGYQAAKAADPQAMVLFAGLSYWSNQDFFQQVLDRAVNDPDGRGGGFYFDVLPWHPYIDPYYVYSWALDARDKMQRTLGIVKPVWVNETGIPACGEWATFCSPSLWYRATLDEQAAFVIQAYAYAVAADVQRLSIFQLWDDGLAPSDYYGLVANSGTTRPSYKAYQVATTYLSHPARVTRSSGSGYEMIVLQGTPQGKVTVVWATGGSDSQVAIPAVSNVAKLVEQNGSLISVNPSAGSYRLTLPGATNNRDPATGRYIEGGKPYLLVEPFFDSLASQVSALPAFAGGSSFAVSWVRQDAAGTPAVFDIQYRAGAGSSWVDWLTGTSLTSAAFGPSSPVVVQAAQTYYFRCRIRESQGAIEPWPDGDGDTHTTIPVSFTGRVIDNRGIGIVGARVTATSLATIADANGSFRLVAPPGTYSLSASAYGYGTIPSRSLTISSPLSYTFVLPPLNNYMQNWGFEGTGGVNEWWVPVGQVATSTDWMHSGAKSARLGEWNVQEDATVIQAGITIPAGTYRPIVSFLYAAVSSAGPGDTLFLDVTGLSGTTSYPVPLDTQGTWAQKWFDLGDLSGSIALSFRLDKATASQLRVFLDEVSVGKASGGPNVLYFPQVSKK